MPRTKKIAYDQVFADTKVFLDGVSFHCCRFNRCESISSGLLGCNLVDPRFVDCRWTATGPAQNAMQLLTALYTAGAVDLIEATLSEIHGKKRASSQRATRLREAHFGGRRQIGGRAAR